MRKLLVAVKVILVIALIASDAPIVMAESQGPMLKMIAIEANAPGQVNKLARMGIDISEVVKGPVVKGPLGGPIQTYRVEAVVSSLDLKKLKLKQFS